MKERIEEKIHFYRDKKLTKFPLGLLEDEKKEYFKRLLEAYNSIGANRLLKEIRIMNSMGNAGETAWIDQGDTIDIIISVCAIYMGIGSGLGVTRATETMYQSFSEVISHELLHARNIADYIDKYGEDSFRSIVQNKNMWTKLAWKIMDEYKVCYKNANCFDNKYTVETLERVNYCMNMQSCKEEVKQEYYNRLLYSIVTLKGVGLFEKEVETVRSSVLKEHIYKIASIFSMKEDNFYSLQDYEEIGNDLQKYYDVLFQQR